MENPVADNQAGSEGLYNIFEYNIFWTELSRITSDFGSDVEQTRLPLQRIAVTLPSYGYNEIFEQEGLLSEYESLFDTLSDKNENDVAYLKLDNGKHQSITKKRLRHMLQSFRIAAIKNKRNRNFLHITSFVHLVTLFDAAMQDIILALFKEYPYSMVPIDKGATIQSVSYTDVLNSSNIDELKNQMIEREVLLFGYKSISEQIKFINKILIRTFWQMQKGSFTLQDDQNLVASIVEIRETRNIHVHNKGIVNKIYINNVSKVYNEVNKREKDAATHMYLVNAQEGFYKEITDDYIDDSIRKCVSMLDLIKNALIDKFISKDEQDLIRNFEAAHWAKRN
jgi:hypothetical protein